MPNIKSTLIDNTSNLKMVDTLRALISQEGVKEIKIATGYWDLLGLNLVKYELKEFLNKEGNTLKLLIGKDPYPYIRSLIS